jgi:lipopolysaccharide transport system ATP-binding protein
VAGAYEPTFGSLLIKGRVASLLDINLGMDHDATGYENIFIRGVMMGLTPSEIRSKTDEIADFTELGPFLNMPIRTYSSGMQLRLAFAVSTSVEADIIVMDEWLSVGDSNFKEKAAERLKDILNKASILILASHDEKLISRVCNRIIKMEHGKIVTDSRD